MARRRIGSNELKQLLLCKCTNPSPSGQYDVSPFLFTKEMLIRLFIEVSHQCHSERSCKAENTPTVCSVSTGKLQNVGYVCNVREKNVQQNSTYPEAGYRDRQLSGSAWPFG